METTKIYWEKKVTEEGPIIPTMQLWRVDIIEPAQPGEKKEIKKLEMLDSHTFDHTEWADYGQHWTMHYGVKRAIQDNESSKKTKLSASNVFKMNVERGNDLAKGQPYSTERKAKEPTVKQSDVMQILRDAQEENPALAEAMAKKLGITL